MRRSAARNTRRDPERQRVSETLAARIPRLAALSAQVLGWSPDTFWRATPADLALALSDPHTPIDAPLSRTDLETLLEQDRHG